MKSLKLTIKGRVQKVGYRNLVDEVAFNLNVRGYAKNLDDKTVEIVAEHEDKNVLGRFIEMIKIEEYPIKVTDIKTEEIQPKGYKEFEVIEGALEIENRESLEAGATYMRKLAGEMKLMRKELGEKIDRTNENTNKTNETLGSFSNATMDRFDTVDTKYGKISETMREFVDLFRATFKPKEV